MTDWLLRRAHRQVQLTLVLLNPDIPFLCNNANSVDPDQLKPTDLELHCLSFCMWMCVNKLDQVLVFISRKLEVGVGSYFFQHGKKGKRTVRGVPKSQKVQGVQQSQTAPFLRHQEEEETEKKQRSANRTNVQKTPRLALSSPSKVIAMLKELKNTRRK